MKTSIPRTRSYKATIDEDKLSIKRGKAELIYKNLKNRGMDLATRKQAGELVDAQDIFLEFSGVSKNFLRQLVTYPDQIIPTLGLSKEKALKAKRRMKADLARMVNEFGEEQEAVYKKHLHTAKLEELALRESVEIPVKKED